MVEKDCLADQNDKAAQSISIIRDLLNDPEFIKEHRTDPKFFTRQRKLGFVNMILLILQKSVKSLQLIRGGCFKDLGNGVLVTSSAFTFASDICDIKHLLRSTKKTLMRCFIRE